MLHKLKNVSNISLSSQNVDLNRIRTITAFSFPDTTSMTTAAPTRHFGEPDITSSPIYHQGLKSFIDCGSYITYAYGQDRKGYGPLISTVAGGNAMVNKYVEYDSFIEDHDEVNHVPLENPYIEVKELIQTPEIIQIPPRTLINILFIFRKDDVVDGIFPCEGVECAYIIRFRFVDDNLTTIPCDHFFHFRAPTIRIISQLVIASIFLTH